MSAWSSSPGGLAKPPGLDEARKSPTHAGGYDFVYSRMRGRAHQNCIKGGTLASVVSQPLTLELSTTLDLAETSALDYYAWYVVPFEGENYLVLIGHHLAPEMPGGLLLTVAASIKLPPYTDSGIIALAS